MAEKYHNTTIDCKLVLPAVKELVRRCGGAKAAAAYALVGYQTIYRIQNEVHCTVQRGTAEKIVLALKHKKKEDEERDYHLRIRQEQARREERLERLTGY